MEGPARGGRPRILGRARNSQDLGSRSDSLTCQFQKGRLETLDLNCSPLLQNVSVTENLTSAHCSEDMTPCGRRVTCNISAGTFECWEQVGNINANPMLTSILINFHKFWISQMSKFSQMKKSNISEKKKINEEPEKQDLWPPAIQFYSGGKKQVVLRTLFYFASWGRASQWVETEPATEQPKPGLGWVMLSALGSCCNRPRAFLHLVVYLFVFSQTCTVLEESIPRPLPDRLYQQSQNERFVKVFQVVPTLHSL